MRDESWVEISDILENTQGISVILHKSNGWVQRRVDELGRHRDNEKTIMVYYHKIFENRITLRLTIRFFSMKRNISSQKWFIARTKHPS